MEDVPLPMLKLVYELKPSNAVRIDCAARPKFLSFKSAILYCSL